MVARFWRTTLLVASALGAVVLGLALGYWESFIDRLLSGLVGGERPQSGQPLPWHAWAILIAPGLLAFVVVFHRRGLASYQGVSLVDEVRQIAPKDQMIGPCYPSQDGSFVYTALMLPKEQWTESHPFFNAHTYLIGDTGDRVHVFPILYKMDGRVVSLAASSTFATDPLPVIYRIGQRELAYHAYFSARVVHEIFAGMSLPIITTVVTSLTVFLSQMMTAGLHEKYKAYAAGEFSRAFRVGDALEPPPRPLSIREIVFGMPSNDARGGLIYFSVKTAGLSRDAFLESHAAFRRVYPFAGKRGAAFYLPEVGAENLLGAIKSN